MEVYTYYVECCSKHIQELYLPLGYLEHGEPWKEGDEYIQSDRSCIK